MTTAAAVTGVTGYRLMGGIDLHNLHGESLSGEMGKPWPPSNNSGSLERHTLAEMAYGEETVCTPPVSQMAEFLLRQGYGAGHVVQVAQFDGKFHTEIWVGKKRYRNHGGSIEQKGT